MVHEAQRDQFSSQQVKSIPVFSVANSVADSLKLSAFRRSKNDDSMALLADYLGLKMESGNSNLAAPTHRKAIIASVNGLSRFLNSSVANSVADTPITRQVSISRLGHPYRKARVVKQADDKWFIIFYAWDITKKKLVRKRVGKTELNELGKSERAQFARELVTDINTLLASDAFLESDQPTKLSIVDFSNKTVIEGINLAMAHKRDVEGVKKSTVDEYISTRTTVEDFFVHARISLDYKLKDITPNFVNQYFEYLKTVRKSANKTYNCRRTILHSTCEVLMKKDPKIFKGINPFASVAFLKTESRKHAAYTDEQMKLFAEAMIKKGEGHVLLFMQFMFYSLARPEELRHLKVGHIRMEERRILFQSQTAKTSIEQYVGINDRFAEIISNSRILSFPNSYYVFSNEDPRGNHYPGQIPVGPNYFYKRVKKYIRALGLHKVNANYTMYSFKHSGAISLYKATKDIKLLMEQCRHQKIDQTNTYLRDLGLFSDLDRLNKWNGPL